jgi:hypothetical protein
MCLCSPLDSRIQWEHFLKRFEAANDNPPNHASFTCTIEIELYVPVKHVDCDSLQFTLHINKWMDAYRVGTRCDPITIPVPRLVTTFGLSEFAPLLLPLDDVSLVLCSKELLVPIFASCSSSEELRSGSLSPNTAIVSNVNAAVMISRVNIYCKDTHLSGSCDPTILMQMKVGTAAMQIHSSKGMEIAA